MISRGRSKARRLMRAEQAAGVGGPSPPVEHAQVRLAIAGDVGHPSTELDRTVSTIVAEHQRRPFDSIILLGDNIYPDGDPERLGEAVLDPLQPVLDRGVVLTAVLGNHDVQRGLGDDVARGLGMPGRWYERRFGPAQLIALDSNRIDDREQLEWLSRVLTGVDPVFRIVALHHPPYSAGWHGSSRQVRRALRPLIRRHRVDLVLSGHEHDYQRSKCIRGTVYVVSGAASYLRPTGRRRFTAAAHRRHHFVDLWILNEQVIIRAIGHDGRPFDEVTLPSQTARRGPAL